MPPVPQQQTLRESASFEGVGLHSGNRVGMSFLPAPPNTGIRFRRLDLDGRPEIEARIENVSDTTRSTTLSKGNIRVHTVEHVLATFAGYGIDNVVVELDANEPPIADGSARAYCKMIESAGISPQPEKREPYTATTPLEFEVGDSVMSVFPHDRLKITCTSAVKPSHTANCELARQLAAQWRKPHVGAHTFAPPIPTPTAASASEVGELLEAVQNGSLDVNQIMKILPHRYPFLMVDRVTKIDGTRITGVKNISIDEPYFQGHFPNHPIMPGVLQLEAIAQVAGILTLRQAENMGKLAYF